MVRIRGMRMGMLDRIVFVRVGMRLCRRTVVLMLVMLVVDVDVLVLKRFMHVVV